jgi:hypothetical protein
MIQFDGDTVDANTRRWWEQRREEYVPAMNDLQLSALLALYGQPDLLERFNTATAAHRQAVSALAAWRDKEPGTEKGALHAAMKAARKQTDDLENELADAIHEEIDGYARTPPAHDWAGVLGTPGRPEP